VDLKLKQLFMATAAWKKDLREKGIEAFHGRRGRLTMDAIIYNPRKLCVPNFRID